jgi:hypothetical protein
MTNLNDLNSYYNKVSFSLDLWDPNHRWPESTRSSTTGYAFVKGVCSSFKYSIIEDDGFNNIQNAAHELGHMYATKLILIIKI